jgi:hypothetical protein
VNEDLFKQFERLRSFLASIKKIKLSEERQAPIRESMAKYGCDANTTKIAHYPKVGERAPFWDAIEGVIRDYRLCCKLQEQYPVEKRHQIKKRLEPFSEMLRHVLAQRQDNLLVTYLSLGDLGPAIEPMIAADKAVIAAIDKAAELPGSAAPADGKITQSQRLHYELARDPEERLIRGLSDIFATALHTTREARPVAELIEMIVRPTVMEARRPLPGIENTLRKLRKARLRIRLEVRGGNCDAITIQPPKPRRVRRKK